MPHPSRFCDGWVRLHHLVLPLAAFLAVLPLIVHGCSCGHDFDFHLLNWMEAARQFAQGNLHPHWAFTPAYNAGEPRFVFYPPLSWTIGAILGFLMPWTWTPIVYTWLVLTAAGFALYRLAREFTTPNAALLASAFYLVNPYTLFTAYERTAYAELLAAVWIPFLLLAILREEVTIPRIAIPVALLWLTNDPAAVMGCYALALLTLIRLFLTIRTPKDFGRSGENPGAPCPELRTWVSNEPNSARNPHAEQPTTPVQLILRTTAGTLLGLGLAAFYILPAAYERRYVEITLALVPGMRIQDNFLFHHTHNPFHDAVLHTASLIAILLLILTAITLLIALAQLKSAPPAKIDTVTKPGAPSSPRSLRLRWASRTSAITPAQLSHRPILFILASLTIAITFLLTSLSNFLWNHVPELAFLQFPWRLLAILAAVTGLAIAVALNPLKLKTTATTAISLALVATLALSSYHLFRQFCYPEDTVSARLALFHSNDGAEPVDEYTPSIADNDSLSQGNPPFWLIPNPTSNPEPDPNQPAPANSTPGPAPTHLTISSPTPQTLVLNLRDYPAWRITLNQTPITTRFDRNDGLIAIPLPAGLSHITIAYTHTLDQTIGDILTLISLALLLLTLRRKPLLTSSPTS